MISLASFRSNGIIVRNASKADLPVIVEIYNEAILNSPALFEYALYTEEYIQDWFNRKVANNFPVFVACKDTEVMGFCSYGHFREWPGYKYTVESTVYVHEDHGGEGIGKLLISFLNDYVASKDFHTIIACIESTNTPSINLFKSFGYMQMAEFKQVGFKFNRWLDLLFFQLLLSTPQNPNDNLSKMI